MIASAAAQEEKRLRIAHNHSVVPGEDGKFIEAGNKVPSSGDVASYEDAEGQRGERVHRRVETPRLLLLKHSGEGGGVS